MNARSGAAPDAVAAQAPWLNRRRGLARFERRQRVQRAVSMPFGGLGHAELFRCGEEQPHRGTASGELFEGIGSRVTAAATHRRANDTDRKGALSAHTFICMELRVAFSTYMKSHDTRNRGNRDNMYNGR